MYLLYEWGCSKGSLWNFCQDSMLRSISKGLYGKDDVLSHSMCELGKTGNDKDKYPNIIEDCETAKKLLLQSIFLSWRYLEKIKYQSY